MVHRFEKLMISRGWLHVVEAQVNLYQGLKLRLQAHTPT